MAETELKKAAAPEVSSQGASAAAPARDTSNLLAAFGGFAAVRGFLPDADNMNPAKKAAKNVFLTDKRFADKREQLKKDLRGWIELLGEDHGTATEFADACKAKEEAATAVLKQGITDALFATKDLERSYRQLDSFFKTANTDKVKNLRIINVVKEDIADPDSGFGAEVDNILKNGFDRLSLKDAYSLVCVPGDVFTDKTDLLTWAKMAFKYKAMLITDHSDEYSFDDLQANTEGYKDSDQCLMNVIMTANWIVGRESEKMSVDEEDSPAFYIAPAAALCGKLYDESANMAQGAGGKGQLVLGFWLAQAQLDGIVAQAGAQLGGQQLEVERLCRRLPRHQRHPLLAGQQVEQRSEHAHEQCDQLHKQDIGQSLQASLTLKL